MTLSERLNAEQTSWRPETGGEIEGTVVEISERAGDYGAYPVVVLAVEGGAEVVVHAFHSVLKSELAKQRPAVGDHLGVKYLGEPAGKSYKLYRVVVERKTSTAATPDWDAHAKAAGEEMGLEEQFLAAAPTDDAPPPTDDDAPPAAAHDEEVF